MILGPYTVTSSNSNGRYPSRIRVKRDGVEIAKVECDHDRPLQYARKHWHCAVRKELVAQLANAGVSQFDIDLILKVE